MSHRNRALAALLVGVTLLSSESAERLVATTAAAQGTSSASGRARSVRAAAQKPARKKERARKAAPKAEPAEAEAEPQAKAADDGVKFSKDVAPLLVSLCIGCHEPRQKRGKLDLTTFEKLMEGTPQEKVIVPGKPEESHLVLRVRGDETPKMPLNSQRGVSEGAVAKIEAWVKAGARLDAGLDPKAAISSYAASADDLRKSELSRLSNDDRDKKVQTVGLERWKKASPKTTPVVTPGAHFLLFSTLPKERANAAVKTLETQYGAVKSWLGPRAVEWGEKASLFVFSDAASFGEFVRANEQRDVEPQDAGTARMTVPEPYVAVIDPSGGRDEPAGASGARKGRGRREDGASAGAPERSLAGLLTEWFVAGSAAKAGNPPRWVSLGLGAYLGSRVEPRSPYYRGLRRDAHGLMEQGWASKAGDALGDAAKVEDVRAVGFALLEWLAGTDRETAGEFVRGMLAGGDKLDFVIEEVLNGKREDFLGGSADFIQENYGGGSSE